MIRWSHRLHQLTGQMARYSTSSKPPSHALVVEWAEALLLMAREMREYVEGERKNPP
jgi:hypothetical protein